MSDNKFLVASPAARPRCSAWARTLASGTTSTPSLNLSDWLKGGRRNRSHL